MEKSVIISAFAGIGKTTLGRKYPGLVVDLETTNYKKINTGLEHLTDEERKGIKRDRNPAWPQNYITEIKALLERNKIVLISQHREVLDLLRSEGIEFIFAYPSKNQKSEFEKRYRERGNNEAYVQKRLAEFDEDIEYIWRCHERSIEVKKNEFLEQALIREGILSQF